MRVVDTDPFLDRATAVARLVKEYRKHPKLIIAVDFDDTIYDYQKSGANHQIVIDQIKQCQALGFYIVIFTASAPDRFDYIREHCKKIGLEISAINENPIPLPFGNHKKIYYNILLDDRAGLREASDQLQCLLNHIHFDKSVVDKLN